MYVGGGGDACVFKWCLGRGEGKGEEAVGQKGAGGQRNISDACTFASLAFFS